MAGAEGGAGGHKLTSYMFETAELGLSVPDDDFERREPELRDALLRAQYELSETNVPVLILFAGVDGA